MPTPSYHSGAEGIVVCNGVDWQVTGWNGTETTNNQSTTNTSTWNPVTKKCWETHFATTSSVAGSFTFIYDSNNDPSVGGPGPLTPGQIVPASFMKTSGKVLSGNVILDNLEFQSGGPEGLETWTCNWKSNGEMLWS
jgi:hypothetical protein